MLMYVVAPRTVCFSLFLLISSNLAMAVGIDRDQAINFIFSRLFTVSEVCQSPSLKISTEECMARMAQVQSNCPTQLREQFPASIPDTLHQKFHETMFSCHYDIVYGPEVKEQQKALEELETL